MLFFVQLPNKFKSTKLKSQEAFYRQILRNTTQRSYHFRLLMKESQIFWKSSITCFCVCADMLCLVFIEYVTVHYDQLHGHLHFRLVCVADILGFVQLQLWKPNLCCHVWEKSLFPGNTLGKKDILTFCYQF